MATPSKRRIHIIMLGESHVGKTALVRRYHDDTFTSQHITTLGIDFITKEVHKSESETIIAKIWDTAGQEKFRTITKSFYKQANGILLVFDLTDRESFDKLHSWVSNINETAEEDVVKFLVGNKLDIAESRAVNREEALKIASEYDMRYFETSAKYKINVHEVFSELIEDVSKRTTEKGLHSKVLESAAGSRAGYCC